MTNYLKQSEGKVVSMWEGKNSTYWCLVQYWIGTGYQYVERQCSQEAYEVTYYTDDTKSYTHSKDCWNFQVRYSHWSETQKAT